MAYLEEHQRYLAETMDINKLKNRLGSLPGCDLIIRAADYQNSTDEPVSPEFEFIENGQEAANSWFDSDLAAADNFIPFAQTFDGGLFAFWKCENSFPIVYLASECEGTRVIARTAAELLSLVAFGSESYDVDITYTDQDEDWTGPEEIPESLVEFREWLESELGIAPAESPLAIIKASMAQSPDLMNWVRNWQARKYGTD